MKEKQKNSALIGNDDEILESTERMSVDTDPNAHNKNRNREHLIEGIWNRVRMTDDQWQILCEMIIGIGVKMR